MISFEPDRDRSAARSGWTFWAGMALLGLVMGCQSPDLRRINWDDRVGVMTYDEAVAELGKPTREVELSDGYRVVQWQQKGSLKNSSYNIFRKDWVEPQDSQTGSGWLSLSFDSKDLLYGWKWVYK